MLMMKKLNIKILIQGKIRLELRLKLEKEDTADLNMGKEMSASKSAGLILRWGINLD